MKIGVKIWPDKAGYAYEIAEHCDFIEVMAKRGSDFSFLEDIGMPVVVHAEHHGLGVNFCDSRDKELLEDSIKFATGLADRFDARAIIVHPGFTDGSPMTSESNAISFLKSIKDNRVVAENECLREDIGGRPTEHPASTPDEMAKFLAATGKGMCLDFSHTNVAASFLGKDASELLEGFFQLRPKHFHACGGIAGKPEDLHMHLWEGNLDIGVFKRMLPKSAWVTLETPTDLEGQIRDIGIMRE